MATTLTTLRGFLFALFAFFIMALPVEAQDEEWTLHSHKNWIVTYYLLDGMPGCAAKTGDSDQSFGIHIDSDGMTYFTVIDLHRHWQDGDFRLVIWTDQGYRGQGVAFSTGTTILSPLDGASDQLLNALEFHERVWIDVTGSDAADYTFSLSGSRKAMWKLLECAEML